MKQYITLSLVLITSICTAQTKLLTIDEAVLKGRTSLAPSKLANLQWLPSSTNYSYTTTKNELIICSATNNKPLHTVTLSALNKQLKTITQDTLQTLPMADWADATSFTFNYKNFLLTYNLVNKLITATGYFYDVTEMENADKAVIAHRIAYTEGDNLSIQDGRNKVQVTTNGSHNIVYGQAASRSEFGITKGTFWSTKGNLLAFYKVDQTQVTDYPIIDWTKTPAVVNNIKYPFAGNSSQTVSIGVYNLATKATVYLQTGEPTDKYLTNISWSPDEQTIYVAEVNRAQNAMKLNSYNASNGAYIKTLFEEADEKYTEPQHTLYFNPNNAQQFIWQTNKDGNNHLYLYDVNGTLLKQLTKGNYEVLTLHGIDGKNNVYYASNESSFLNNETYKLNIITGVKTLITQGVGQHATAMNYDFSYAIDNHQSTSIPRVISVINTAKNTASVIHTAPNPIADYALGTMKLFTLNNAQGTPLQCRMFLPTNFDSTKKYPVVVYLYNGSHVQLIKNTWLAGGELWYHYMAQKGFIIFTLDGRGSDNRGKAFEQATHRKLGTVETEDQLVGINYLKQQRYVDATRLGIHGWSFGGFMTTSFMTRNAGVFKVGVAGGPVIDWKQYEIMYTERYMDTPQENEEGYKANCLLNHADKLQGKLLMIHGCDDDVVTWQNSMQFVHKCNTLGKQLDYYAYPAQKHNVTGKQRAHLLTKITNYFIDNL
ncbi:MAG: DPP IV N-terminal domain-containing protein [Bacteroidia bacterium]|nr:DPP IV N-terminal domain-containing protein [Bacteroidia bacterium]